MSRRRKRKVDDIRNYPSNYPSRIKRSLSDAEWRKQRTIELYDYLPKFSDLTREYSKQEIDETLRERAACTDIRDEIVYINYKFFGYVAAHSYVKGFHASYEDKFQSALTHFCTNMWAKYRLEPRYRSDLSFSVFFKPRLSECISRDLNIVKHSMNRSIKKEAADQLGIHYSKLTYEDLNNVNLSPEKMESIKAIFRSDYCEDVDEVGIYLTSSLNTSETMDRVYTDDYNSITELLQHEMIEKEGLLKEKDLKQISDMMGISLKLLKARLPYAEESLKEKLTMSIEIGKSFTDC